MGGFLDGSGWFLIVFGWLLVVYCWFFLWVCLDGLVDGFCLMRRFSIVLFVGFFGGFDARFDCQESHQLMVK